MVYNIQAVWNDMHAVSGMLHYFQAMAKKHQSMNILSCCQTEAI